MYDAAICCPGRGSFGRRTRCCCAWMWCASYLDVVRVVPGCGARCSGRAANGVWIWRFCAVSFVFCLLSFVLCLLCFVFCVFRVLCRPLLGVGKWWAIYSHIDLSLARDRTLSAHHWPSTRVFLPVLPDCYFLSLFCLKRLSLLLLVVTRTHDEYSRRSSEQLQR